MKRYKYLTFIILALVGNSMISCSIKSTLAKNNVDKTVKIELTQTIEKEYRDSTRLPPVFDENYNKCFSFANGYSSFLYTDTIRRKTRQGNFLRKGVLAILHLYGVAEEEVLKR